jgi:hypothetical protein
MGLHKDEREGYMGCVVRRGRQEQPSIFQQGRGETCMARLVACRDAMAAGRGSGGVVGVRALWTVVRHTEDNAAGMFPVSSGLRPCMLAASGESDTFGRGCRKSAQGLPDAPCLTRERLHS